MNIEIRQLQKHDWVLWKEIRLEALQLHPDAFGSSFEEVSLWSDEEFQQMLLRNDMFGGFVKGELAGVAGFFIYELQKLKHRGCLFGLYVKKEYRGKGVARQLIIKLVNHASSKVMQLHCTVTTDNTCATHLYQKLGFKIYGTEPKALKVAGKYYDEHLMAVDLSKR